MSYDWQYREDQKALDGKGKTIERDLKLMSDGVYWKEKEQEQDPIVQRVIDRVHKRSQEGMKKYGVTMERPDVTTVEWLRHAQEEALDLAVYLERCISDLTDG